MSRIVAATASLTPAQRTFVDAAEALGATTPAAARPVTELPRLASSELTELVESGLVREAADWRYYVFRPRGAARWSAAAPPGTAMTTGRLMRTVLFWILLVLIPILLLQFSGAR